MAIQVIDNYLDKNYFFYLQKLIMGDEIPWFYNNSVSENNDDDFYFTHCFYREYTGPSKGFEILNQLLKKLKYKKLIRIKANLYTSTEKSKKHRYHIDNDFEHKGLLLYFNTNNGYNYFKEKKIKKVKPVENRVVFFNPSIKHCSSTCTDEKRRITLNINYE